MFAPRHLIYSGLIVTLAFLFTACGQPEDPDGDPGDNDDDPTAEVTPPGETLQSGLERDEDPQIDDELFEEFTGDNRNFAFSLVEQLREQNDEENVFLSPHSISVALAMTYAGAENETRDQMSQALRFELDDDDLHPAFNRLDLDLAERSELELDEDESLDLDIVNQTWGHHDFDFVDDYLDLLVEHYGAAKQVVDFENDYEPVREGINEWVEYKTEDRIDELLPEDSLNRYTRYVLVNAIYFFATWDDPFDEDATRDRQFVRLDDSTVDVPMMSQDRNYDAFVDEDADTTAVSVPYAGEEVSMVLLKPSESGDFEQWEQDFDREMFDDAVEGLDNQRLDLSFPRFEDEANYEMSEVFEKLGMVDAFDECAADFEGITGHPPCIDFKSLFVSEIFHSTFISVDEEGTEAAGATAVVGDTPTSAPPSVDFDRPFYYAIYDHPTDTIVFLGRMVDPS